MPEPNVEYEWNFGDGTTRIDTGEVSHVYSPTVTSDVSYTVIVTATNGFFPSLSQQTTGPGEQDRPSRIRWPTRRSRVVGRRCRASSPSS